MAGTRGIRAGRAFVELGVSDKLAAGLKRAQKRLKAFGAGLRSIGTRIAVTGAAALTPLFAATRKFASMGDEVNKMSARTGISAEALSELSFAAEQSGADLATLEKGVRTLQRSISDAERGLSTATDGLDDLGLTFDRLRGLSPEEQFKLVADRLSEIDDPSKRAAVAMQLLGRAGTRLLPMMRDGAKGIEELQEQARSLGLTISTDAAKDAALLTDTMNILRRVLTQSAFAVGAALAPTLIKLSNTITRVVTRVTEWIKQNRAFVVSTLKIVAAVTAGGLALITLGLLISGIGAAIGTLAAIVSGVGTARDQRRREAKRTHDATMEQVAGQWTEAEERVNQEAAREIAQTQTELNRARDELNKAIAAARDAREAAAADQGPPGRTLDDALKELEDRFANLGGELARKGREITVAGTFNPLALQGLQTSSAMEETARATAQTAQAAQQTARHTKTIARAAANGQLVFAP